MDDMKRTLGLMVVALVALASCGTREKPKTREELVVELVDSAIRSVLYVPESYEPTYFEMDSAFAPMDDPEFYDMVLELYMESAAAEEAHEDMEDALKDISRSQARYTRYSRQNIKRAEKEHDEAYAEKMEHEENVSWLADSIDEVMKRKPVFIGMKVKRSYRAKNQEGKIGSGEVKLILSKDSCRVVELYDMDSEEWKCFLEFWISGFRDLGNSGSRE